MARYILVHQEGKEYVLPESPVPTEAKLHNAFESHPQLLPAEELNLGRLMVVGREVAFESGAADLIYVDEGGQVLIVELKRGTENPDSRRVVAQMLDYGAQLWNYTFDEFESKIALPYFRKRQGSAAPSSLRQAANIQFGFEDSERDVEAFADALSRTLKAGTFTYAIIARTLPPTLVTVLRYIGEVSRVQTAAMVTDFYDDGDRHNLAPRVVFSTAVFGQGSPREATPSKTTVEHFLMEVGPEASPYWAGLIEFLGTLPGRFYWGSKGFSYRMVMDDKQYTVLRGYPRTVWWLLGKGKGDQLEVVTTPRPHCPEAFVRLVTEATSELKKIEGATPTSEGAEKQLSFYVNNGLPKTTDDYIRQALGNMFGAGS